MSEHCTGRVHELKTWPEHFGAVAIGAKSFEYRLDDRGFMVGDKLKLRLWDPSIEIPGRAKGDYVRVPGLAGPALEMTVYVKHILHGGRMGIPEGYCVMSIKVESMNFESPTPPGGES